MTELALAAQTDVELTGDFAAADEAMWVDRARAGDADAFDAIMRRYETRLLRFLIGLVGDVEIARELCQDAFLAAYQALPRIDRELRLSAWLHTIALNRARSYHRRARFRRMLPLKDDVLPSWDRDVGETAELQEVIRRTLARLPRQYAEALLLQTVGGLSCREIGQVADCSEGAAKVRLMRAREAFKRVYREEAAET